MEKQMNVMGFMNDARAVEDARIAQQRGYDNVRFYGLIEDVFTGITGNQIEMDSFQIAALVAMSTHMEHTYRTDYSRLYNSVKDFIVNPFTCTLIKVPGEAKGSFECQVVNKVAMEPLDEMDYDVNAKWGKKVVDLFKYNVDYFAKYPKVMQFADELRELYHKYVSI